MRGNPRFSPPSRFCIGSIPTHAGKPPSTVTMTVVIRVYPHACGETRPGTADRPCGRGLSPRMRGNRALTTNFGTHPWSIPTHAGKPEIKPGDVFRVRVYPHACGETVVESPGARLVIGLSPRMRGNLDLLAIVRSGSGSIPTHAGKPFLGAWPGRAGGVYPHACGETRVSPAQSRAGEGLSPRMRGNRVAAERAAAKKRSIPTHAGKPRRSSRTGGR